VANSSPAGQEEGRLAGERFAADVAYARSLSISRPDDPVIVKVNALGNRYWLARSATPDTPITHPTTKKPYLVSFGPSGNSGLSCVQLIAYDLGGDSVLGFDSMGNTDQQTDAVMQVSSASQSYEVTIRPVGTQTKVVRGLTKVLAVPEACGEVPIN
jgi:hypothetical protein